MPDFFDNLSNTDRTEYSNAIERLENARPVIPKSPWVKIPVNDDPAQQMRMDNAVANMRIWKETVDIMEEAVSEDGQWVIRIFHGLNGLNNKFGPACRMQIAQDNFAKAIEPPNGFEAWGHEMSKAPLFDSSRLPPGLSTNAMSAFYDENHLIIFKRVVPSATRYVPQSSSMGQEIYEDPQVRDVLAVEREKAKIMSDRVYDMPDGLAWTHSFSASLFDSDAQPCRVAVQAHMEHLENMLKKGYEPAFVGNGSFVQFSIEGFVKEKKLGYHFGVLFWQRIAGPKTKPDFPTDDTFRKQILEAYKKIDTEYDNHYPKQALIDEQGRGVVWSSELTALSGVGVPKSSQGKMTLKQELNQFREAIKLNGTYDQRRSFLEIVSRGYESAARKFWQIYDKSGIVPEMWHFQLHWEIIDFPVATPTTHIEFMVDVGVKNVFNPKDGSEAPFHDITKERLPVFRLNSSAMFQEVQHDMHEGRESPAESATTRQLMLEVREPIRFYGSLKEMGTSMLGMHEYRVFRIVSACQRFPEFDPATFRFTGSFRIDVPIPGLTKLPVARDEIHMTMHLRGSEKIDHFDNEGNPISDRAKEIYQKTYSFHVFTDSQGASRQSENVSNAQQISKPLRFVSIKRDPDSGKFKDILIFQPKSEIYSAAKQYEIVHKRAEQGIAMRRKVQIFRMKGKLMAMFVNEIIIGNDDDETTGEGMRKLLGTAKIIQSQFDMEIEKNLFARKVGKERWPDRQWDNLDHVVGERNASTVNNPYFISIDPETEFPKEWGIEQKRDISEPVRSPGKTLDFAYETFYELNEAKLISRYGPNYKEYLENLPAKTWEIEQSKYILHRNY